MPRCCPEMAGAANLNWEDAKAATIFHLCSSVYELTAVDTSRDISPISNTIVCAERNPTCTWSYAKLPPTATVAMSNVASPGGDDGELANTEVKFKFCQEWYE